MKNRKQQRKNEKNGERSWADKEFASKEQNLRKQLKDNRRQISEALSKLLESSPKYSETENSITYH